MKVSLLLFFAFTAPILLFLATVLYGNASNDTLKSSLKQYGIYSELSKTLAMKDVDNADGGELYGNFVAKRFSADYIQTKAESAIDDSSAWITGKTKTQPVVNFKELKEDMVKKYPFFVTALQNVPTQEEMTSYGLDAQQQQEFLTQRASISDFVQNDFSFPLGQYLGGFRDVYTGLKFAVPILVLLLIFVLFMIAKLAEGMPAKFNWIGATFMTTALIGFGVIFFNSFILAGFTSLSNLDQASYLALITPILLAILRYFMAAYLTFQGTASIVMFLLAAGCFIGAVATRKMAPVKLKKLQASTYWEKPSKKK